jgi:lysophospholipase L1-like esterase
MRGRLFFVLFILSLAINIKYFTNKLIYRSGSSASQIIRSAPNTFNLSRRSEFEQLKIDSNDVVFVGNSLTDMFELSEFFGRLDIKNRGIAGDITDSIEKRMKSVLAGHPRQLFLEVGVNDLLGNKSTDTTFLHIKRIVALIRQGSPRTNIVLMSLFPTNWKIYGTSKNVLPEIVELNERLKAFASGKDLHFLNAFNEFLGNNGLTEKYDCGDGLHLNGEGYKLWKRMIDSAL